MRFSKGHKDATRRHIVETASRQFRKDGIAAVGIKGVMADAGLTIGGFYKHFESKDHLVQEAVLLALDEQRASLVVDGKGLDLEGILRAYLSRQHRDNPEHGCPAAALLPEIARGSDDTRKAYSDRIEEMFQAIASKLSEAGTPDAGRKAFAIYSLLVGAIQVARAMINPDLSDSILEGSIQTALEIAAA